MILWLLIAPIWGVAQQPDFVQLKDTVPDCPWLSLPEDASFLSPCYIVNKTNVIYQGN
ncbi:hypothetical protein LJC67_03770 [Bacteroidales bacterium OttesenSCG-928-A14]|nr:hypothetical protein [Bacteroidales bacterium OttesenSCG-928-A14]